MIPKTPSRQRSRSEAKTPLTPSLIASLNAVSLSPTKRVNSKTSAADLTNPFIARSTSPVKRTTSGGIPVSASLQRQASAGVIRKGGIESKLDVVTRDYVPPPPKSESKRSRSTPATQVSLLECRNFLYLYSSSAIASSLTARKPT